jgi:hypothetical protein
MMQDLGIHLDDENHPNFQDLSLEEREIRRTLWVSGPGVTKRRKQ